MSDDDNDGVADGDARETSRASHLVGSVAGSRVEEGVRAAGRWR